MKALLSSKRVVFCVVGLQTETIWKLVYSFNHLLIFVLGFVISTTFSEPAIGAFLSFRTVSLISEFLIVFGFSFFIAGSIAIVKPIWDILVSSGGVLSFALFTIPAIVAIAIILFVRSTIAPFFVPIPEQANQIITITNIIIFAIFFLLNKQISEAVLKRNFFRYIPIIGIVVAFIGLIIR